MKVAIYGKEPDMLAIAEMMKHVPNDTQEVLFKCPQRIGIDVKPCQHPGWLIYDANLDNTKFINLVQKSATAPYEVTLSW
jgi:hypothetical protein